MLRVLCRVLPAVVGLLVLPCAAWSWAINSHIYQADIIMEDILDDGMVTFERVIHNDDGTTSAEPLCTIAVPAHIVTAITQCPLEFRAGSCCADLYPDMYIGQSIIHPYVPGQRWRSVDWARHVVNCAQDYGENDAQRNKAVAFAAGWLVHLGGDAIGHTWVNNYAGGAWDWGNMSIVSKHVAVESYVNSKLPGAADGSLGVNLEMDMDPAFVRDALMLHDDIYDSLQSAGYMVFLIDYYDAFKAAEDKCERRMDDWWNPVSWGIGAVEDWLEHQRKEANRAMYEWGETSTAIGRDLSSSEFYNVPGRVTDWTLLWTAKLCLGIPQTVLDVIGWLGQPIDWVMGPVEDEMKRLAEDIYDELLRDTFEDIVNPEQFMLAAYGPGVMELVDAEMHVTADHPEMLWPEFIPFHDSVVIGKLALLDKAGIEELNAALGVEIPMGESGDNILYDAVNSMDASNQLALYPVFRLLETEEMEESAYRPLFKGEPYQAPPSAIDPAHVVVYFDRANPLNVVFGIPLPDPCNDQRRVIGYLYQEHNTGGPEHRAPIFEHGVPTHMSEGLMTDFLPCGYAVEKRGVYKFHLATTGPVEGSTDMIEDRGIDVSVDVGAAGDVEMGQVDLSGMAVDPAAIAQFMEAMAAAAQQAGQHGGPQMTPEQLAAMQEALQRMREGLQDAEQFQAAGGVAGALAAAQKAWAGLEPLVFPTSVIDEIIAHANEPFPTMPEDMQIPEELQEMWQNCRTAIGVIEDAEGNPLEHATVTLVEAAGCAEMRASTRAAHLRFDQYTPGKYYMGRTNEQGQYCLQAVRAGEYVLIASAAGHPKVEQQLAFTIRPGNAVILPAVRLMQQEAEEQTSNYTGGQHPYSPDFTISVTPRVLTPENADEEGALVGTILLRAIGNFQGQVQLAVEGLPDGIRADFAQNPAFVDAVTEVPVSFTGSAQKAGTVDLVISGTAGALTHQTRLVLSTSAGEMSTEPGQLTIKRGGETTLRVKWSGPDGIAPAARFFLDELPAGITVRAHTIKAHKHVEPLKLIGLTPTEAEAHNDSLRKIVPIEPIPRPERPQLTVPILQKGPEDAPVKGILLGPEGWVDLLIIADADAQPGTLRIPVKRQIGFKVTTEVVELPVE